MLAVCTVGGIAYFDVNPAGSDALMSGEDMPKVTIPTLRAASLGPKSTPPTHSLTDSWSTLWRAACLVLFSLTVSNPFISFAAEVKFGLAGALVLAIAKPLRVPAEPIHMTARNAVGVGFILVLLVIVLRMRPTVNLEGADITAIEMTQGFLSVAAAVAALSLYRSIGKQKYLDALTAAATTTAIAIGAATGWRALQWGDPPAGDITFDSYQQVAVMFGLSAVLLTGRFVLNPLAPVRYRVGAAILVIALFWYLLNNPARGEAVALMAGISMMVAPKLLVMAVTWFALFPSTLQALIEMVPVASLRRMAWATDRFGLRDQLFAQALDAATETGTVVLFGGGGNRFQEFIGAPSGFHPHNIFLEAAVSAGLLGMIVVGGAFYVPTIRGVWAKMSGRSTDPTAVAACVFLLIVYSKSNTLVSSWTICLWLPVFLSLNPPTKMAGRAAIVRYIGRVHRPERVEFRSDGSEPTPQEVQPAELV